MPSPTVLVLDGGLGTTLEDKHNTRFSSNTTPLWSSHLLFSNPQTLLACQKSFSEAGADILLTATYQVSQEGFKRTKTEEFPDGIPPDRIPSFLSRAVSLAEEASNSTSPGGLLALSLGPYGATMVPSTEYTGVYDEGHNNAEKLLAWHAERLSLFTSSSSDRNLLDRVHVVALETLPRADEIHAVRKLRLLRRGGSSAVKFWISVVYPNGETMPDGTAPEEAVRAMLAGHEPEGAGETPWGIGINCTKVQSVASLVRRYEDAVSRMVDKGEIEEWPALALYPDGTNGAVYDSFTRTWRQVEEPMAVGGLYAA